jgi:prevent-host-death family protein
MNSVGVRALKNQLSGMLRRVKRGETVTVTERGRPIAILVPVREEESHDLLRILARTGRFTWSGGKPTGSTKPPRVRGRLASDVVVESRR